MYYGLRPRCRRNSERQYDEQLHPMIEAFVYIDVAAKPLMPISFPLSFDSITLRQVGVCYATTARLSAGLNASDPQRRLVDRAPTSPTPPVF